jgi:predicted DNA-binding transcriptional regulator AlpA
MEKTVLISLSLLELQSLIIDCVNRCLKYHEITNTAQPIESDRWLDINELCSYLPDKPTKATVYSWVHQGIIPNHKGNKKLSFLKSEIDTWLKQRKRKSFLEVQKEAEEFINHK